MCSIAIKAVLHAFNYQKAWRTEEDDEDIETKRREPSSLATSERNSSLRVSTELDSSLASVTQREPSSPPEVKNDRIMLRLEALSKRFGFWLNIMVVAISIFAQALIVFLFAMKFENDDDSASDVLAQHHKWFVVGLCISAATLLFILVALVAYVWQLRHALAFQKELSTRRKFFVLDALMLQGLQIFSLIFLVLPYALAVVRPCPWFDSDISVYAFLRWTFINSLFIWMCVAMHSLTRYRPKGAPESAPIMLLIDAPMGEQVRRHSVKLAAYLTFEVVAGLKLFYRLRDPKAARGRAECDQLEMEFSCTLDGGEIAAMVVQVVSILLYALLYCYYQVRAQRDHARLPYVHFRLTFLYLKTHWEHGIRLVVMFAVSLVVLQLVQPSNCWSYIDVQFGLIPVQIVMGILVLVFSCLLAPVITAEQSLSDLWSHNFVWTEVEMASTFALAHQRSEAGAAAHTGIQRAFGNVGLSRGAWTGWKPRADRAQGTGDERGAAQGLEATPPLISTGGAVPIAVGNADGSLRGSRTAADAPEPGRVPKTVTFCTPEVKGAAGEGSKAPTPPPSPPKAAGAPRQLGRESRLESMLARASVMLPTNTGALGRLIAAAAPASEPDFPPLFCMETALKMHYFSRLAYRYGTKNALMTPEHALGLIPGLSEWEILQEAAGDVRAFAAWGGGSAVLAFRGTVSRKNVVTDLKAWLTPHLPERSDFMGRRPQVHAGFYQAWRRNGFAADVAARIEDLRRAAAREGHDRLRLYLCGHSLGGALAQLASVDLSARLPDLPPAECTVYTFGTPRVGNRAFVAAQAAAVPDSWSLVNDCDPVPRLPKGWGFRRAGRRMLVNARGDIVVDPDSFDLGRLTGGGSKLSHHRMPSYAISLFCVLRSQFRRSKALEGGREGALALARIFDLSDTLVLANVGLEDLVRPASRRPPLPKESLHRAAEADPEDAFTQETDACMEDVPGRGPGSSASLLSDRPSSRGPRPPQPPVRASPLSRLSARLSAGAQALVAAVLPPKPADAPAEGRLDAQAERLQAVPSMDRGAVARAAGAPPLGGALDVERGAVLEEEESEDAERRGTVSALELSGKDGEKEEAIAPLQS